MAVKIGAPKTGKTSRNNMTTGARIVEQECQYTKSVAARGDTRKGDKSERHGKGNRDKVSRPTSKVSAQSFGMMKYHLVLLH